MTRRLFGTLAALALLLAACGDDDDTAADRPDQDPAQDEPAEDDPAATTSSTAAGTDDASGGGEQATAAVTIAGFAFEPPSIEVAAGDTVVWTNEDGVAHTVTAGEPGAAQDTFDESLDAGATAEISFDEAGTYPYFCAIHPSMTGEVVVS